MNAMNLDPVRLKVLELLEKRNPPGNLKNASQALGRNAAYLHQFIYRGTPKVLAEDDRALLADYLGCDEDVLRHRTRPARKLRTRKKTASKAASVEVATPPAEGFVAVPEIDVRASAGAGAINEGFVETREVWYFPETVIRHEFRARPADLRVITIDGDSMEPLLHSGDRIMIDMSQRLPAPPGIFVIWDGIGLVAKRIEPRLDSDESMVVVKSINPDYETYERDAEEVHIAGRVVWAAHRL